MFDDLVKYGADVNLPNNNGNTALFFAGTMEQAKWLIQSGADIYHENNKDENILIHSIKTGNTNVLSLVHELYAQQTPTEIERLFYNVAFIEEPSQLQRQNIEKSLYSLLKEEELKQLFPEDKSVEPQVVTSIKEINYQDEDGNSPILVACANDNPFLVSLYIKLGADVNLRNENNESPLMHAIANNNEKLVKYLIEKGADINAQTNDGKSVLDFAMETENKQIIESIKIKFDLVKEGQLTGLKTIKPR